MRLTPDFLRFFLEGDELVPAPPAPAPTPANQPIERVVAPAKATEARAPRPRLARGARGQLVRDLQRLLQRAGHALPRFGTDGHFGGETQAALLSFQAQRGLPRTGVADAATWAALGELPPVAPDYDALFADGVLRGAMAVGHDESDAHLPEVSRVRRGLAERGYRTPTPEEHARLALGDGRWLVKEGTRAGQRVTFALELITPELPDAKARFARAMAQRELVLYGGHGRYGSGPDFDDIKSPHGNYVIGQPTADGVVTLGPNDVKRTGFTPAYQLLYFDGCNTFRYFDDLRTRARGKSSANLDLVGSTTELYWHVTAANLLTMLDGVSAAQPLDALLGDLDEVNRRGPADEKRYFTADGFDDNP